MMVFIMTFLYMYIMCYDDILLPLSSGSIFVLLLMIIFKKFQVKLNLLPNHRG